MYNNSGGLFHFIQINTGYFGRADRLGDINHRIGVPFDNINLFIVQFFNDSLDTHASNTHTGSDRVHIGLGGRNSHFGTLARLARNGADFNDAVIDFRDLVFQQAAQEIAMRARKDDLRAARAFLYFQDDGTNPIMNFKALTRDLLVLRHDPFGFHVQANRGTLSHINGLHHSADNFSDLFFVIIGLHLAFSFADALLNNLAGCLGSNTAEILGSGFNNCHITQVGFRAYPPGVFKQHLSSFVLYIFDNFLFDEDAYLSGLWINFSFNLLGVGCINSPPICRDHGRFNGRKDDLLGQLFFFQNFVERQCKFVLHNQPAPRNLYYTQKSGGRPLFDAFGIGTTITIKILAYKRKSCKDLTSLMS